MSWHVSAEIRPHPAGDICRYLEVPVHGDSHRITCRWTRAGLTLVNPDGERQVTPVADFPA